MVTAGRVLPWRRGATDRRGEISTLLDTYAESRNHPDEDLILSAYTFAELHHRGQLRASGEPYITHPVAVAVILARYGVDEETICAALLHDVVEDCDVTLAEVEDRFGPEVARLVDGCTKLSRASNETKEQQKAETLRKVILAMANDLRVILIKLADRLHNMRTLAGMSPEHQERVARETLEVYAPLAHRLGMSEMRQLMEDLCFASIDPNRYAEIDHMVTTRSPERDLYLGQVIEAVKGVLKAANIDASVSGRPKHLWSIYEKMVVRGRPFNDIHDLLGIRVVVAQSKDCYAALGLIHGEWTPIQGRFKDYIAHKKFNNYQSIHTTVIGPGGKPIEIQIRTYDMHRAAEVGAAAHFAYKEQARGGEPAEEMAWLRNIVDWQQEVSDPAQFLKDLKVDLGSDDVYVFTPKGKLVALPQGSTPVDFAYAIHTEVGHRCIGAKVNSQLVPLDAELESGDTVSIVTSKVKGSGPREEWLDFVRSRNAQHKIRAWLARERREDAAEAGRDLLERALRRDGLPSAELLEGEELVHVAGAIGFTTGRGLFQAIGEDKVSTDKVVKRLKAVLRHPDGDRATLGAASVADAMGDAPPAPGVAVHVDGFPNAVVRLAKCCTPMPPDDIEGFQTKGRGIVVHRTDCPNGSRQDPGTWVVDVEWASDFAGRFQTSIVIRGLDRPRLLSEVTAVVADYGLNILRCEAKSEPGQVFAIRIDVEVTDPAHLSEVLERIRDIDSVFDANRAALG